MPASLKHRCNAPWCRALTSSRFCSEHTKASNSAKRTNPRNQGTRQARGYGADYQRERAELLASGNELCVWCGAPATQADHVPPIASFPSPDLWEGQLVPSCAACNEGGAQLRQ